MKEKSLSLEKFMGAIEPFVEKLTKIASLPFMRGLQNGMMKSMPVIMVGSIFMVLQLFVMDGQLTEKAILGFLTPYSKQIYWATSLTLNIFALYMSFCLGSSYGAQKGLDESTAGVVTTMAFLLLTYAGFGWAEEGTVSYLASSKLSGSGVVVAMVAAVIAINIMNFCYKHNIRIKLPDSVPPAIGESFSAIIPGLLIAFICWFVRSILNFDLAGWFTDALSPIFSAADNVFTFTLFYALMSLLWACGLHGDNIMLPIVQPFFSIWQAENIAAQEVGATVYNIFGLPHIWAANTGRLFMWVSSMWPLLFFMFRSSKKLPHMKPMVAMCTPPAIFGIVEPMVFTIPIALNPILAIPMILAHTVTAAITYIATSIGFIGTMMTSLPWATPAPILAFLTCGGFRAALIVLLNVFIGGLIMYPFWKIYEKQEIAKLQTQNETIEETV